MPESLKISDRLLNGLGWRFAQFLSVAFLANCVTQTADAAGPVTLPPNQNQSANRLAGPGATQAQGQGRGQRQGQGQGQGQAQGQRPKFDPTQECLQAQLLLKNRRISEARQKLQFLCGRPDATALSYCLLAETFLDFEGTEDNAPGAVAAMQGLHTAIQLDPHCGRAYKDLATLSNMRGRYVECVDYATKALAGPEPQPGALRQRALAYSHLNRQADALKDIDEFIKTKGQQNSVNYMLRGDLLQALRRYKEAADSYRLSLAKTDVYQARCFNSLLKCLAINGDNEAAVNEITRRIVIAKDDPELFDMRGQYEMKMKKYDEAVRDFSRAIDNTPVSAFYEHRIAAYEAIGQKKPADEDRAKLNKLKKSDYSFF